jgi:hypothetical protein
LYAFRVMKKVDVGSRAAYGLFQLTQLPLNVRSWSDIPREIYGAVREAMKQPGKPMKSRRWRSSRGSISGASSITSTTRDAPVSGLQRQVPLVLIGMRRTRGGAGPARRAGSTLRRRA